MRATRGGTTSNAQGGAARTAALSGRILGRGERAATIRLVCGARCVELPIVDDSWGCFGLPAGRYRVELVGPRLVVAREVELADGHELELDFAVH